MPSTSPVAPVTSTPHRLSHRAGRHGYDDLIPDLNRLAHMGPQSPRRDALRDHLICEFLPLAQNLAHRYRTTTHAIDDVEQAATLGLIKAIDRYDPAIATGGPLGYLVPSVRGAILRYLRDHSWALRVPRDLKELSLGINRATDTLTQQLGRAPKPSELAAELDTTTTEVVDALQALDSYRPASLDAPGPDGEPTLGERLGGDDTALITASLRGELRAQIAKLPEREHRILTLRFFHHQTQSQIGEQIGVSQMHVSRLLARILADLRDALDG